LLWREAVFGHDYVKGLSRINETGFRHARCQRKNGLLHLCRALRVWEWPPLEKGWTVNDLLAADKHKPDKGKGKVKGKGRGNGRVKDILVCLIKGRIKQVRHSGPPL
jgi:hypothetical protein